MAEAKAAAIIANRYDGIDFPGDECRFLAVDGLPRAVNLQERFFMSRMGAAILFEDRVQTRALQAVGRCTRSLEDYSAVFVTGAELLDYLADKRRWKFLHPELQAELAFGVEQSSHLEAKDFEENFGIFLRNDREWQDADAQIIADREQRTRSPLPSVADLHSAVSDEVRYQAAIWSSDFSSAVSAAESVLGELKDQDLRGYRALWHYLAGSAAWLATQAGEASLSEKASTHFKLAKKAAPGLAWLVPLSSYSDEIREGDQAEDDILQQVEQFEAGLVKIGAYHDATYSETEKNILDGLNQNEASKFEAAQVDLGRLLGFTADNKESDAAPDPWWISKNHCIVFEDHSDAKDGSTLGAVKARQAAGHPNWLKDNVAETAELEITSVIVTPARRAESGALPHLHEVVYWELNDFRTWAINALAVVRERRSMLPGAGDLDWRAQTVAEFRKHGLSASAIAARLETQRASSRLDAG